MPKQITTGELSNSSINQLDTQDNSTLITVESNINENSNVSVESQEIIKAGVGLESHVSTVESIGVVADSNNILTIILPSDSNKINTYTEKYSGTSYVQNSLSFR